MSNSAAVSGSIKYRDKEWMEWRERRPTTTLDSWSGSLGNHRGLSRLDSITHFRDGARIMSCPKITTGRPPAIESAINDDRRAHAVTEWIRKHHYFGIVPKNYAVKWINLGIGSIDHSNMYPASSATTSDCGRRTSLTTYHRCMREGNPTGG